MPPKHSLLFLLRRFFGLTDPELFWIRAVLLHSPTPFDDMSYAVEVGAVTENTMRECVNFHRSHGTQKPLDVPALLWFLEH